MRPGWLGAPIGVVSRCSRSGLRRPRGLPAQPRLSLDRGTTADAVERVSAAHALSAMLMENASSSSSGHGSRKGSPSRSGTSRPLQPSRTMSSDPPAEVTTSGAPAAVASSQPSGRHPRRSREDGDAGARKLCDDLLVRDVLAHVDSFRPRARRVRRPDTEQDQRRARLRKQLPCFEQQMDALGTRERPGEDDRTARARGRRLLVE